MPREDDLLVQPTTLVEIERAQAAAHAAETPRGHLGMSQIGNPDTRTLWLKFRWSLPDVPTPRTLRIFKLGDWIEMENARLLRLVPGVDLRTVDAEGNQFSFRYLGGHFAGSMDGAVIGLPEAPMKWHVWESKSVSGKRFGELVRSGVQAWSPEYYGQVQCYMGATGMERALFMAHCKEDSRLHVERVRKEPMYWEAMQEKARRIIEDVDLPASTWKDRSWYESRFLSEEAQAVYWGDRLPAPNCRNCRFSEAVTDARETGARWHCHLQRDDRSLEEQRAGCQAHQYLPTFFAHVAEIRHLPDDGDAVIYRHKNGSLFANGERSNPEGIPDATGYPCWPSASLKNCPVALIGDQGIAEFKREFESLEFADVPF